MQLPWVTVTVYTDDVLVFGKGLSEEFLALYQATYFVPTISTKFAEQH
jgi:adenosine deaminase